MKRFTIDPAGLVLVFLAIGSGAPRAMADVVTFDSAADLANFNVAGSGVQLVSGGIGGSGAIQDNAQSNFNSSTLAYQPQSFDLSAVNDSISLSVMFHYKSVTHLSTGGGNGASPVTLNLSANPNPADRFSNGISAEYAVAQLAPNQLVTHHIFMEGYQNGSGAGLDFSISPLIDGHWYQLASTFSLTTVSGQPRNGFTVTLSDFGLTGGQLQSVNFQRTATSALFAPVLQDSTVWTGFTTELPFGTGADRVDNFTIGVPEPSGLALGALALVGFAAVRWSVKRAIRLGG
jgi:hypothetical protein